MIAAAALAALAITAGPPGALGAAPDSLIGPDRAVPFVAQGPLLCGGAAAAMIERYWGASGVYAEDYAPLVRTAEGGIRTDELAAEIGRRGYRVRTVRDRPDVVFEALARGAPAILLLGGGQPLHYVVLVGADSTSVRIHDPNFGPRRQMGRTELLRLWGESGMWALLAVPVGRARARTEAAAETARPGPPAEPVGEPGTAGGAPTGTRAPEAVDSAIALLRSGELERAIELAHARLLGPVARRILATARFLEGDTDGALDEWNRLGEPRVDLVRIEGARRTRYHVLEDRMGFEPREVLTRRDLRLARRRLAEVPAVGAARVGYRPLPDGTVQVEAFVAERPRWPSRIAVASEGTRALAQHEAALEVGPLMAAGDRWGIAGGWDAAWPYARASVATVAPPLPGIVELSLEWRREVYGAGAPAEERVRGELALSEWVAPSTRLGGRAGLERWPDGTRMGSLGASALFAPNGDVARVTASADGWIGSADPFARVGVLARAEVPSGAHSALRLEAGGTLTTASAPRLVWPGAGTGRVRAPLLRAHPLARDGAIDGVAFGPRLVHATVEHRIFERLGPARWGGALFVDAARVWSGAGVEARSFVDPGVGVFASYGEREAMLAFARGEAGWVTSVRIRGR